MTFTESMTQASQAYTNLISTLASQMGISVAILSIVINILSIWALAWKGVALWKSARKKSLAWFVLLLIVNTLGILEILYIFIFSKMGEKKIVKIKGKRRKR